MYLVEVPTPIALPFAVLNQGRSGGLIFQHH